MIFLPVLIGFTYEWFFTEVKKSRTLAGMIVSQFLIVACSVRYSIFVAITVLLFGILVHFMYKKKPGILPAVAAHGAWHPASGRMALSILAGGRIGYLQCHSHEKLLPERLAVFKSGLSFAGK